MVKTDELTLSDGSKVTVQSVTRGSFLAFATIRDALYTVYPAAKDMQAAIDAIRPPEIVNVGAPTESEQKGLADYASRIAEVRAQNRSASEALDQITTFATIGSMIRDSAALHVTCGRMDRDAILRNFDMYLTEEDADGDWYRIAEKGAGLRAPTPTQPDPTNGNG